MEPGRTVASGWCCSRSAGYAHVAQSAIWRATPGFRFGVARFPCSRPAGRRHPTAGDLRRSGHRRRPPATMPSRASRSKAGPGARGEGAEPGSGRPGAGGVCAGTWLSGRSCAVFGLVGRRPETRGGHEGPPVRTPALGGLVPGAPGVEAAGNRHCSRGLRHLARRRHRPGRTGRPPWTRRVVVRRPSSGRRRAVVGSSSGRHRVVVSSSGPRRARGHRGAADGGGLRPPRRSRCRGPASSVPAARASRSDGYARASGRAPCRPPSGCARGRPRCRSAS